MGRRASYVRLRVKADLAGLTAMRMQISNAYIAYNIRTLYYGFFQEFGFRHWRSGAFIQNPFLIPALEAHRQSFYAGFREVYSGGRWRTHGARILAHVVSTGEEIVDSAKAMCPVDTGALRDSIALVKVQHRGI